MATRRPVSPLRASLRASTSDGTCHAAMVGFGELYFPAFALLLGATPFQVGLLATLPILAGSAFQLAAAPWGAALGQKRWVVGSAFLQALTFAPIVIVGVARGTPLHWLLLWVTVYWVLALGINPSWNAWMGRMVPVAVRSRFFGRRNLAIQGALLVSSVGAGMLIHGAERSTWGVANGFVAIFVLAGLSRLASAWFLARQHDSNGRGPLAGSVREVFDGWRHKPYGRLILLLVLINGAVHVSAAYFTPFMLQELALSYAEFTVLNGVILVSRALASPYWGEIAAYYGNRRALQVSALLLIPLSALWVVSSSFAYLVALQVVAGFAWAGFELTSFLNFFDCTDERNRTHVLTVYNLLNGIAIVTGSVVGGLAVEYFQGNGYLAIFLASGVLRAVVVALVGPRVGAKRPGEHSFSAVFTRVVTLRPGQGPDLRPVVLGSGRSVWRRRRRR